MNAVVQPTLSLEPEVVSDQTALPATTEPRALQASASTPLDMLNAAIARGVDMPMLEKLMDLHERFEKREAEKAFTAAMAEFKKNPPEILKTKRVYFEAKDGGPPTDYKHATLADVCAAAIKGLAGVGISHRWELTQGERITVTCILTHAAGHSERTTLHGAPDATGKKSPIQQVASTVTFLERYTLLAATGLAAKDMVEDDGRGAGGSGGPEYITERQVADLEALITEVGADRNKFLVYARVAELAEIEAKNFKAMCTALRARATAKSPNQKKA